MLVDQVPGGAGEGSAAGDHLVERAAERVLVGAVVEGVEQIFYDAEDDVLRHTITLDYSGQPYVTRHVPTAEELARRE
ncbi:hypothetical protein [Streptomyces galbus]|uniref:hypothetical protein n=1 Tax=Streptomyces galbus TaxID=33898 RepID=UPI00144AF796|nr:hypothetical protein [Streptomyces galbus]